MIVKVLSTVQEFINSLDDPTQAKVYKGIKLLREFGPKLNQPHSKKIGNNLYELRTLGKIQIRIVYCFNKDLSIVIHGFIKKSNKISKQELKLAKQKQRQLAF